MISKFFIIAAIVGLFPGTSNQVSKTALISGLEYALTQSKIADAYGVEATSDKKKCKKVVVVNSSNKMDKAKASYINESDLCLSAMSINELFFEQPEAYFEIDKFSDDKNEYNLSLQLITPEYNPPGKNQLFLVLKYSFVDGLIKVTQFDQIIQQYEIKIKKRNQIKIDLLKVG